MLICGIKMRGLYSVAISPRWVTWKKVGFQLFAARFPSQYRTEPATMKAAVSQTDANVTWNISHTQARIPRAGTNNEPGVNRFLT